MTHVSRMMPATLALLLTVAACSQSGSPVTPQASVSDKARSSLAQPADESRQRTELFAAEYEPQPLPRTQPGDPLHYFTNRTLVIIRRPVADGIDDAQTLALWWTDNNGFHWNKAGTFERGQKLFPFRAPRDGDFGVRFVQIDRELQQPGEARVQRVYHVDTTLPEVSVRVRPEQQWYARGDEMNIAWHADDYHLVAGQVRIGALLDLTAEQQECIELRGGLEPEGEISFVIPDEFAGHEFTIRVEAVDLAGNLGVAYSHAMRVIGEAQPEMTAMNFDEEGDAVHPLFDANDEIESPWAEPTVVAVALSLETARDDVTEDAAAFEDDVAGATAAEPVLTLEQVTSIWQSARDAVRQLAGRTGNYVRAALRREANERVAIAPVAGAASPAGKRMQADCEREEAFADPFGHDTHDIPPAALDVGDIFADEFAVADRHDADAPRDASEFDIPPVVPFATAIARMPEADTTLVWKSGAPAGFPQDGSRDAAEALSQDASIPPVIDASEDDAGSPVSTIADREPANDQVVRRAVRRGPAVEEPQRTRVIHHPQPGAETEPVSFDDLEVSAGASSVAAKTAGEEWRGIRPVATIDPTRGGGLMVPLPATVSGAGPLDSVATAHPWRVLGEVEHGSATGNPWDAGDDATLATSVRDADPVWSLPEWRRSSEPRQPYEGRFLADVPQLRTVAAPGGAASAVVEVPADPVSP